MPIPIATSSWRDFHATGELADLFEFAEFLNQFRRIERTIWYLGKKEPEGNGEHSFQLALFVWFANHRLKLGLDPYLLIVYALVHDLWERYAGDTPAFHNDYGLSNTVLPREGKELREEAAFDRIKVEWRTKFPEMIERMEAYWNQSDRESRFVKALEKLLAMINVTADGGRTWRLLCITLEDVDRYNRPRVIKDPAVAKLYEELFNHLCEWRNDVPMLFPDWKPVSRI